MTYQVRCKYFYIIQSFLQEVLAAKQIGKLYECYLGIKKLLNAFSNVSKIDILAFESFFWKMNTLLPARCVLCLLN